MLIERITEYELREAGPPGRACTPIIGKLHDKTKISKENLRVDLIVYCYNIARGKAPYFPLPGPNHLQNLTPKRKILNVF